MLTRAEAALPSLAGDKPRKPLDAFLGRLIGFYNYVRCSQHWDYRSPAVFEAKSAEKKLSDCPKLVNHN